MRRVVVVVLVALLGQLVGAGDAPGADAAGISTGPRVIYQDTNDSWIHADPGGRLFIPEGIGAVTDISAAPDGTQIATATSGGTVREPGAITIAGVDGACPRR